MKKNRLFLLPAVLLALVILLLPAGCRSEAQENYDAFCTVSVVCDDVLDGLDALDQTKRELIPEDGVLLRESSVGFLDGATAYDVFESAAHAAKLQFEADGTYLTGIGNLYAGDCGAYSGWFFEVNGAQPDVGCGQYAVADGDAIVFRYVCDYMAEFEAE